MPVRIHKYVYGIRNKKCLKFPRVRGSVTPEDRGPARRVVHSRAGPRGDAARRDGGKIKKYRNTNRN